MKVDSFFIKRSCSAFCIVFSYILLKPLKLSLFSHFAGLALLPYAQILSMVLLALLLMIQSRYSSTLNAKVCLNYMLTFSLAVTLALMIIVPVHLECPSSLIRYILGFIVFVTIDIISITSLQLFWSTCHITHSPQNSQTWYPIFIWIGQLAATGAPAISWLLLRIFGLRTTTSITLILFISSLSFLLARIGTSFFPSQQPAIATPDTQKQEFAPSVLNNRYIVHIALLGMIYETLRISLEYSFLLSLQTIALGEKSSLLYLYQTCVHGMGLMISSITVYGSAFLKPMRYRLLITPLLSLVGISICIFGQSTLILATSLIIIQGFYNGLHYPTKEILYVQTPTVVHQTLRPWLATFGKRSAQGLGYSFSLISTSMPNTITLGIPLFLAGLWGYSALNAGRYFDTHSKAKSA